MDPDAPKRGLLRLVSISVTEIDMELHFIFTSVTAVGTVRGKTCIELENHAV